MVENKEKIKTSINLNKGTWSDWIRFVVNRTGSARKISEELEKAIQEYIKKHS